MAQDIETIAVADLFGPPSPGRERTDARILAAPPASASWQSGIFRATNG